MYIHQPEILQNLTGASQESVKARLEEFKAGNFQKVPLSPEIRELIRRWLIINSKAPTSAMQTIPEITLKTNRIVSLIGELLLLRALAKQENQTPQQRSIAEIELRVEISLCIIYLLEECYKSFDASDLAQLALLHQAVQTFCETEPFLQNYWKQKTQNQKPLFLSLFNLFMKNENGRLASHPQPSSDINRYRGFAAAFGSFPDALLLLKDYCYIPIILMQRNIPLPASFDMDNLLKTSTLLANVHGSVGHLALAITHFFASCYHAILAKKKPTFAEDRSSYIDQQVKQAEQVDKIIENYALFIKHCAIAKALDNEPINSAYKENAFSGGDVFKEFNRYLCSDRQDLNNIFSSWEYIVDTFEEIRQKCFPDLELPKPEEGKKMLANAERAIQTELPQILATLESQIPEKPSQLGI